MRRRRWGVVLGSVAFHALLVALFVLDLTGKPVAVPPPAMTVFLERAPVPPKARPVSRGGARTRSVPTKTDIAPVAPIAIPAAPAASSAPEAVAAGPPTPSLRGLNGLGGCRLATLDRLPADERARCQERLAQAAEDGPAQRLNLDPTGRYARDPKPYLTRPPVNGCKPVGSVTKLPMGQTAVTMSAGCGKSF